MVFLNHGSFGATPTKILELQQKYIYQMEAEPVRYMIRELEPLWWEAKEKTAHFLGANPSNLVFVKNATMGVNTILHSLNFESGDEVLTTNHAYGACMNTLHQYAKIKKFNVVVASIPFPFKDEDEIIEALVQKITPKTKLLMIDHITSATATIFPIEKIIQLFEEKGIKVLVDGAHAPGMIHLELEKMGASYYVGNCHKWICSPKGSALLYVRKDKQAKINPLNISHKNERRCCIFYRRDQNLFFSSFPF
jgi:isopenicillin-N epimerase